MRKTTWIAGALAAALLVPLGGVMVAGAATPPGLHIANGKLVEKNGTPFVFRGVNHAHTWYTSRTAAYKDISTLGANGVRTVLSSGDRWTKNVVSDVQNVVQLAKDNRMISILEVQDTTGYGEDSASTTLAHAVDYWISIKTALQGQEDYVLVNIGNEPFGNNATANASYVTDTITAIQRLRAAGIRNTIVVDAPNWGQDWVGTMRDNAKTIFAADSDANVLFSIHMYGVYSTASTIQNYMAAFQTAGLPLIVGEFGNMHSDGDPDEDTIMSEAQRLGIGYLGWSWSGNGGGVEYLDMATGFDPTQLTAWGTRIFKGTNGIQATAKRASIFSGVTPTPTPTGAKSCSATFSVVNSWPGGFQAGVTVKADSAAIASWSTSFTMSATVANLWSGTLTSSGSSFTVRNAAWNGAVASGQSTTYGFVGTGTAPTGTVAVACSAS